MLNVTEKTIGKISCVLVEAGTFITDGRKVAVSENFWISKYPITQKQYGIKKSISDNHPVVGINWTEADRFARKQGGFLPSEAQWEWAARGGNKSKSYIYSGGDNIEELAWYSDNSGNKTHTVGQKKPNELGIYDMSGNVWEWCQDQFILDFTADKIKYKADYARVRRGGSYKSAADGCKITHRNSLLPADSNWHTGFRVCFAANVTEKTNLGAYCIRPNQNAAEKTENSEFIQQGVCNTPIHSPEIANVTEKQPLKLRKVKIVEKRQWAIIEMIEKNSKITTNEMAEIFKVTRMTIHRDLEKLKAAGFIKRDGYDNGGFWKILS